MSFVAIRQLCCHCCMCLTTMIRTECILSLVILHKGIWLSLYINLCNLLGCMVDWIVVRGFLTPLFYEDPWIAYHIFFKFCLTPPFASNLTSTAPFAALFLWLNGWLQQILCVILLKIRLSPITKKCFIGFNEISLKMIKNAFYFILKALFVLKVFKFLSWLFGHIEKITWLKK